MIYFSEKSTSSQYTAYGLKIKFLEAVIEGSNCFIEPAAALRSFAKAGKFFSARSLFIFESSDFGRRISPRISISSGI